jgi:Xaa-Pro dipeptidase
MEQTMVKIFDDKTVAARRVRAEQKLNAVLRSGDLVLIFSGEPIQKPGGHDQTYPFLPHPDYFWISGLRRSHGIVAYSKDGGWQDFVKHVSLEEKLWEGGSEEFSGTSVAEFGAWFAKERKENVFTLGQPSVKQRELAKTDETRANEVQEAFNTARRPKDTAEIKLIKQAAKAASQGYVRIQKFISAGVSEREIQLEFETAVLRGGAEKFPYDSIVGSGTNSAVLHAIPTTRVVKKGELVLVDAGADIHDYCVDITRVFCAGKFSSQQKEIYNLVLKAQKTAITLCRPGMEWVDVHKAAARVIAAGLNELNLFRCDVDTALETGAVSLFFPHGVGHMVGQRVRDVGGIVGKAPRPVYGLKLRADFVLEENFIMTAEPGIYFVAAILDLPANREKFRDLINWKEVDRWRKFGGIRIEDDILVKAKPENLTAMVKK